VILEIVCGKREAKVEVSSVAGRRKVKIDGKEILCDVVRLAPGRCLLILDGRVYDHAVEFADGKCFIVGRSGTHVLRVTDMRRLAPDTEADVGNAGLQRVRADMPGKVVRVLAQAGDRVSYDQPLLVLEAMKMQNEIRAPKSGVVRELVVASGQAVGAGEFLFSIE